MPPVLRTEPVTDALLDRMVQAIVDEVDPEQIILFGSRGRGEKRENSDIDLIVVEAEPFGPGRSRHKELVRLYHALAGFHVPTDVLVYSHEDVAYWRDSLNHVLARALREGKVLFGPATVANHPAVAKGVDGKHHTSDGKCARMLLGAATIHVDTLRVLCRSDEISDEVFGFHAQQATEKLLKARIALLGNVYPSTHDIEELLNLLAGRGAAAEPFGDLADYTQYAVKFCYTGMDPDAEPIDRENVLALVQALLESVGRQLAEAVGQ